MGKGSPATPRQDHRRRSARARRSPPRLRREFPELVTVDPADDDEAVFGEAWGLIQEWRDLKDTHPSRGKGWTGCVWKKAVAGGGAGVAGGARPDPAAGDLSAQRLGPQRPGQLAAQALEDTQKGQETAGAAAGAAEGFDPGPVARVGDRTCCDLSHSGHTLPDGTPKGYATGPGRATITLFSGFSRFPALEIWGSLPRPGSFPQGWPKRESCRRGVFKSLAGSAGRCTGCLSPWFPASPAAGVFKSFFPGHRSAVRS